MEAGNGDVYKPFEPVAVAVTGAALGGSGVAWLATTATGRTILAMLGIGAEVQSIADGAPPCGIPQVIVAGSKAEAAALRAAAPLNSEVLGKEIGTITTRTTRSTTRLGGEAGEPGVKITYRNGTEFDMTATRVKQTELNPYVPGSTRPMKFEDALNKQGTKRAPTAEEIKWFNSIFN